MLKFKDMFVRSGHEVFDCPECGNLHLGTGYTPDTRRYCQVHARALAEKEQAHKRFHHMCDIHHVAVQELVDKLEADEQAARQKQGPIERAYNQSQGGMNYPYGDPDSQRQGLSGWPFGL